VKVRAGGLVPLRFCYQVLRRGRLLVRRDESFGTEYVAQIVARYLDLKPMRDRALKQAMAAREEFG
jgi:hypothetical protein